MAGKKQLPPVTPVRFANESDVPVEPVAPMSLQKAIAEGTRLDILRAQRLLLAAHEESPNTLARDLAALMRQSRELDKEIEALEALEAERLASGGDSEDDDVGEEAWDATAI